MFLFFSENICKSEPLNLEDILKGNWLHICRMSGEKALAHFDCQLVPLNLDKLHICRMLGLPTINRNNLNLQVFRRRYLQKRENLGTIECQLVSLNMEPILRSRLQICRMSHSSCV